MRRHALTDWQWERLAPLLPPPKPRNGRTAKDHRIVLDGILWVLRTGSPWRCLRARYGSWKTASSRVYRWQQAGVWDRILAELQREADAEGRLDAEAPIPRQRRAHARVVRTSRQEAVLFL